MPIRRIAINRAGNERRIGIVLARFNPAIGEKLLQGTLRALSESHVDDADILLVSVAGALEIPLALQRLAQTGDYDALIALGAVVRGETYHFEIVANTSASGLSEVALELAVPIGNGILTTENEAQALARADSKGFEAAQAALELANALDAIDEE